ncbi:MAG: Cof-type HAD-IIB family hydrolase [Armatimonadota bacterium]
MPISARQLIAVDLDDTLLRSDGTISPRNAAAVARLVAEGVVVVLASGRMHQDTAKYCRPLGIFGPVISYNGAMVRESDGSRTYRHVTVPADAASAIVRLAQCEGRHVNYYLDDVLYVREYTPWSDLYCTRTGSEATAVGDLTQFDGRRPTKLIIVDTPEETDRLLARFRGEFGRRLYITKSKPEYLEFMNRAASKAQGLRVLGRRLGIDRSQMAAIGDSYNDVSMLRYASLGIAMADGVPEAKAAADLIAPPCAEDGFAVVVEQLLAVGWDLHALRSADKHSLIPAP